MLTIITEHSTGFAAQFYEPSFQTSPVFADHGRTVSEGSVVDMDHFDFLARSDAIPLSCNQSAFVESSSSALAAFRYLGLVPSIPPGISTDAFIRTGRLFRRPAHDRRKLPPRGTQSVHVRGDGMRDTK
jgi:hypothetical protein